VPISFQHGTQKYSAREHIAQPDNIPPRDPQRTEAETTTTESLVCSCLRYVSAKRGAFIITRKHIVIGGGKNPRAKSEAGLYKLAIFMVLLLLLLLPLPLLLLSDHDLHARAHAHARAGRALCKQMETVELAQKGTGLCDIITVFHSKRRAIGHGKHKGYFRHRSPVAIAVITWTIFDTRAIAYWCATAPQWKQLLPLSITKEKCSPNPNSLSTAKAMVGKMDETRTEQMNRVCRCLQNCTVGFEKPC